MAAAEINQILISPSWTGIFINGLLLSYCVYTGRRKNNSGVEFFLSISVILFAKDILYLFLPLAALNVIADVLVLGMYFLWIRTYTGLKRTDTAYLVINGICIAVILLNTVFDFAGFNPALYYRLYVTGIVFFLAIQLYGLSPYNTENSEIIIKNRKALLFLLFTYNFTLLFFFFYRAL